MASKTKARKKKEKKSKAKHSVLNKSWHHVPVMVVGIAALILVGGSVAVLVNFISTDKNTEISNQEQFQQNAIKQSELVVNGEKTPVEAAEYWGAVADAANDSQAKADAYFQQYGYLQTSDDPGSATNPLLKILELDSTYTKYEIYDALGGVAMVAGNNKLAIEYYEQALVYFDQEYKDADFYDAVRADYVSLVSELKDE